jgi:hypothetical protein
MQYAPIRQEARISAQHYSIDKGIKGYLREIGQLSLPLNRIASGSNNLSNGIKRSQPTDNRLRGYPN